MTNTYIPEVGDLVGRKKVRGGLFSLGAVRRVSPRYALVCWLTGRVEWVPQFVLVNVVAEKVTR